MKKRHLFRIVLFLGVCFMSLTSKATTVEIVNNSSSGINNADYTATLGDGTVLGFRTYHGFCGVITSATSLVVPDSVIYNGTKYLVYVKSCDISQSPNLTSIEFPSAKLIRDNAFSGCSSLTSISLPSATSIGEAAFSGCSSLTSISLPATASIEYNSFSNIGSRVDLFLLGDTKATWDPSRLQETNIVWVPQAVYNEYKDWTINNGIDVRYEGWEPNKLSVAVSSAGQMGSQILSKVSQWTDVEEIVVSGHLNANDMKYFSSMKCLRKIDLSQTDITSISGCSGLKVLYEIVLPETVKKVETSAFQGCSRLNSINLPAATEIGDNAFYDCSSLTSIDLPAAISLGAGSFHSCENLTSVNAPYVETIGILTDNDDYQSTISGTFSGCSSLTSVSLPSATLIGYYSFYECRSLLSISLPQAVIIGNGSFYVCTSLMSVNLPKATTINPYAFMSCSSLTNIELPSVSSIAALAFSSCSALTSINLPATLTSIDYRVFEGCNALTDIYCHAAVPFPTKAFSEYFNSVVTLHVPSFSVLPYQLHTDWGGYMASVVSMDGSLAQLSVNTDFALTTTEGLADQPALFVESVSGMESINGTSRLSPFIRSGHLDIFANTPLQLGKLDFENYKWVTGYRKAYTYPYCNTMITQNDVTADEVDLSFTVQTDEWNFISFPFDVNVSDIEWPAGTLWAIRHYNGANRAAQTGDTWQDMTAGMTLQAGEGYILQCTNGTDETSLMIKIHAVNNEKKNNIFTYQNVQQPLNNYSSELAHNRSWNLVGNPYPSYYVTNKITHNGVITTWNGNGYTAYSLQDDQYVLHPFEAFFVQRGDAETMTFDAAGRSHSLTPESSGARADGTMNEQTERRVFNFALSNDNYADRTRLVINPQAKADYEISCDASKMTASGQPIAFYVLDGGVRYAIDERPLGSSEFRLGMKLAEAGSYTVQMQDVVYGNTTVVLTDHETGQQTDLTCGDYRFTAEAGTFNNRFTVTLGGDLTGISEIKTKKDAENERYYNLNGMQVTAPSKGVYVVNGRKVVVTK